MIRRARINLALAAALTVWMLQSGGALAQSATAPAKGVIHLVGPTRALRLPSEAARIAKDGDIVEIDPGTYEDCAVWRANRLTLRGKDGIAHVATKTCQGKAIWVIDGDNTTVERIRFTRAAVADKNGAGIRLTGGTLTVRQSIFEDNENGILAGSAKGKTVTIEGSRFERNGKCEPDCAHGIYINIVDRLVVRDSVFRGQKIGHHIKSRALSTTVTGTTIEDGVDGTASYLIDIPNGGDLLIARNRLQKGPRSDNLSIAIAYGLEGAKNPTRSVRIENNYFRSDLPQSTDFVRNGSTNAITLTGNTLCGRVVPLNGQGTVASMLPCQKP